MGTANTSYGNGGMSTVTNVGGYDSGSNDMIDFWNQMARKRRAAMNTAPAPQFSGLGGRTTVQHLAPSTEGSQGVDRAKQEILEAQAAMAKAKAAAVTGRAPLRTSFVGGQRIDTPDSNAMTGAQREVFLPQGSSQMGGFPELSPEDADFLIRMRNGRQRPGREMFTVLGGE